MFLYDLYSAILIPILLRQSIHQECARYRALYIACGGYYILYVNLRLPKRGLLGTLRTPNSAAVILYAVIGTWVDTGAIQVQDVATAVIARSRRPIVAAAT